MVLGLKEKWIDLIYKVATGARMTRSVLTPFTAGAFALFTAGFVFAGISIDRLLDLPRLFTPVVGRLIGFPIIIAGVIAAGWSVSHFRRVRGTPVPFNPPPKLVITGPYAYCRNPMVSGLFLLLFGIGFASGSIMVVFVFTPLYVLIHAWELKNIEEPELVRRLGAPYVHYRERTPMFIPHRKPYTAPANAEENDETGNHRRR